MTDTKGQRLDFRAVIAAAGDALPSDDAIMESFLEWVMELGLELYEAQEEAVLELMGGQHVILNTPTGSGKSMVANAAHYRALCRKERSYYTSPIKALVSEKFFDLCNIFGAEQVGMLTGDASINHDAPVICCTAEVLANIALQEGRARQHPLGGDGRVSLLRRQGPRRRMAGAACCAYPRHASC